MRADEIPGWFAIEEADAIANAARAIRMGGTLVEIGTWAGRSTALLAERLRSWNIFTVDPYVAVKDLPIFDHDDPTLKVDAKAIAEKELAKYHNVTRIVMPSVKAAKKWIGGHIHLLFIDGLHTEPAVKADINAWLPHLDPDAIVFFHDAAIGNPYAFDVRLGIARSKMNPHVSDWRQQHAMQAGSLVTYRREIQP